LEGYERLLKLNAKIRDIDIILSKLPHHGDDPAFSKLAKQLEKMRESSLKKAARFASSIEDNESFPIEADKLSAKLIQKRFKKTAGALTKALKKASADSCQRTQELGRAAQIERGLSKTTIHA
jgi:hypothetical protein